MNAEQIAKWWRWGPDVVRGDLDHAVRDWTMTLNYAAGAEAEIAEYNAGLRKTAHDSILGLNCTDHWAGDSGMQVTIAGVNATKAAAEAALVAIDAVMEMIGRAEPPPEKLVNQIFPVLSRLSWAA